jgi:uncharacterized membrane protein
MDEKKYRFLAAAIIVATLAAVCLSFIARNYLLPIIAIATAVLASFLLKKHFSDVITDDERVRLLSGRASRLSYVIFNISAAVAGSALILLGKHGPESFTLAGYTLVFSVCFMLLADVIIYFWLSRVS